MGRTRQWVCRTKAQRRSLRAGRGSPGAAGRSLDGGEDEGCLLLGGSGLNSVGKQAACPSCRLPSGFGASYLHNLSEAGW